MELFFHPVAAKDARAIASYYASISDELVARFWKELDDATEKIAAFPERHHFDFSGYRRANLEKFPFHLLFEERLDYLRVMVVRHHRRNPGYGLRRK